jgi:hypothetical protein
LVFRKTVGIAGTLDASADNFSDLINSIRGDCPTDLALFQADQWYVYCQFQTEVALRGWAMPENKKGREQ